MGLTSCKGCVAADEMGSSRCSCPAFAAVKARMEEAVRPGAES